MSMSNTDLKLKALNLEFSEDLVIHLVLPSLPSQFGQFKISYNYQKEKWSLNELNLLCVQEEETMKHDKTTSVHFVSTFKDKGKRKKIYQPMNEAAVFHHKRNKNKMIFIYFAKHMGM